MNKRPGQIKVTVETGYCPFCYRVRNLRREERQLGTLVRTIIACESCHRTLSSSMGVAGAEAPAAQEAPPAAAAEPAAVPETVAEEIAQPKPAPTKRPAASRAKPAAASSGSKAPKSRATKSK